MSEYATMLKTGIDGLDSLFGGGIFTGQKVKTCMLLEGRAGCGKTTLALQIGVNIIRERKGIGLVFSIEQRPEMLRSKILDFQWVSKSEAKTLLLSCSDKDLERATRSQNGALFFLSAPSENFPSMRATVSANIKAVHEKVPNKNVDFILVDSISAVREHLDREAFLSLNRECGESALLSSFILDEVPSGENNFSILSYVSDIVILMGAIYRTEKRSYLERYIKILKARNQFHYRGEHPFSIIDPQKYDKEINTYGGEGKPGINVYPSMAARLSRKLIGKVKNQRNKQIESEEKVSLGIEALDRMVYSNGRGGIYKNSSALLIGERGTKKTVTSLHFLAAGLRKSNKERGLLISLKDEESAVRDVAKGYTLLNSFLAKEIKWFQIKHIRPSYITSGRFLDRMSAWIENARREKKPIQRLVFDNFAQIKLRFPLLNADPMFIPTLIDILKGEEITSLFIDIVEEPGQPVWEFKSPILDLADYVIATQHLPFLGKDHTVIMVRRSRDGKHSSEPAEIKREREKIIVDNLAFEGVTGVLQRNPEQAEIFLKLFDENITERTCNEQIRDEFESKYGNKVHVSSFSREDLAKEYSRMKRYWIECPRSIVKVVSLDEYWVKFAANEDMLWEIDPEWFSEDEGQDWLEEEKNQFFATALESAVSNGKLYAIPNHLNVSFFCYRTDLFNSLFGEKGELPKNFKDLANLILKESIKIKNKKLLGFGFDMETEESLMCTFLEFMFNKNTKNGRIGRKFIRTKRRRKPWLPLIKDVEVFESAVDALRTLRDLVKSGIMPKACTLEHCKDSVFSRQWYSTATYIRDKWWNKENIAEGGNLKSENKEPNFGVMRYPAITNKRKDVNGQSSEEYCCSGSWYLGILKQSLRPRLGYHLIDEMTSVRSSLRRYELGAGLPARKSFYRFYGDRSVKNIQGLKYEDIAKVMVGKSHRKILRREVICDDNVTVYNSVRPLFADIIFNTIGGRVDPEKAVRKMVDTLEREIGT